MRININKTREIVFRRPSPKHFVYPDPVCGIDQVVVAKFLGVHISDNVSYSLHVNTVLKFCAQRFHLLRGFITAEKRGQIKALFKRANRYGYFASKNMPNIVLINKINISVILITSFCARTLKVCHRFYHVYLYIYIQHKP